MLSFSMLCSLSQTHQNRACCEANRTQLRNADHTRSSDGRREVCLLDTMKWESTSQPCPGLTSYRARCARKRMATCSWSPFPRHISLHLTGHGHARERQHIAPHMIKADWQAGSWPGMGDMRYPQLSKKGKRRARGRATAVGDGSSNPHTHGRNLCPLLPTQLSSRKGKAWGSSSPMNTEPSR